jgi:hypothetical protein
VQLAVKLRRASDDFSLMGDDPLPPLIDSVFSGAESQVDRRRIGAIFVELGLVTAAELDAAIAVQRETGGMLGEILVGQGKLTRLGLAQALSALWESRELAPLRPVGDDDPVDEPDINGLASRDYDIARESQERVEALAQELRAEAETRAGEFAGRLGAQAEETAALQTWVAALHEAVAAIKAKVDRADAQLRDDLDSLRAQLEELRRIHAGAAQASGEAQDAALRAAGKAQDPTGPAESAQARKGKRPKRKKKDRR